MADVKKAGFFKMLLTEDDANSIWSLPHVGLAIGIVSFVTLAAWHVIGNHAAFDPTAYGTGFGVILGGGGAGILMNGKS
jgi:hypothetical protein